MIKSWENVVWDEKIITKKTKQLEKIYDKILREIFEFDVDNDPNLKETPRRIAKSWFEILGGCYENKPKITIFNGNDMGIETNEQPIIVGPIKIKSLCSHHFIPFVGYCYVAVIPSNKNLLGLSKISRIVQWVMRRPHIQEKLTQLIAEEIYNSIRENKVNDEEEICKGIYVYINAQHMCMTYRGPEEEDAHMITTYSSGLFQEKPDLETKVLQYIKKV